MIDVYFWPTPNGHKITIMLEELELPYRVVPVNIGRGEQFTPEFLRLSPNNRMPAIVDHEPSGGGAPIEMFESGAILQYLAEKTGRFMPADVRGKYRVLQWLAWQVAGLGPMMGQAYHFAAYAPEKLPYAIERYTNEVRRLFGVIERALDGSDHLAGDYSIADMASYPWAVGYKHLGLSLDGLPRAAAWLERMGERPAVQRGSKVGAELRKPTLDDEARKHLFGQGKA